MCVCVGWGVFKGGGRGGGGSSGNQNETLFDKCILLALKYVRIC